MIWCSLPLQWRHNDHDGVSNHQRLDCLLSRLFRRRSKKTWKLCVTCLCEGNSPLTGEFPAQRVSNAENVSIWWRHHANVWFHLWLYLHSTRYTKHCQSDLAPPRHPRVLINNVEKIGAFCPLRMPTVRLGIWLFHTFLIRCRHGWGEFREKITGNWNIITFQFIHAYCESVFRDNTHVGI